MMKKHKKHKTDRKDRGEGEKQPALKLILKVGGGSNSTPEHSNDSPSLVNSLGATPASVASSLYSVSGTLDEESRQSAASSLFPTPDHYEKHKKAKKKKKKKDRSKDRDRKHKHHHKDKRHRKDESSQDDISIGEDSLNESPLIKSMQNTFNAVHGADLIGGGGGGDELMSGRLARACVLERRAREVERRPLSRLLEYLVSTLEKRDVQQFFAWPVTDLIAPGYSQIITRPMDFSTIKQTITENRYQTFQEFVDDFKLMCNNAMEYNHVETIYYKAAKKLLHVGFKFLQPEKIRSLRHLLPFIAEIPKDELGFELTNPVISEEIKTEQNMDVEENLTTSVMSPLVAAGVGGVTTGGSGVEKKPHRVFPSTKFEAIADDLSPEEILIQAQRAARDAKQRIATRAVEPKMGFLRQRKDGTTTLNILIGNDGVQDGTNERPISLGALTGKLVCGTGQLQGFKEDRRNIVKSNKPLYYGAFGSYAPSYDSTFANLSKDESDLVLQTYGDESAVQYAESILDFTKDCDYTLCMVDSLLDILTAGEHSKTKKILDERKKLREEEEAIKKLLEEPHLNNGDNQIDLTSLKSLSTLGIDVSFLDSLEHQVKFDEEQRLVQERLETTSQLLEKLQQVQNDRLSMQPPAHLSNIAQPGDGEFSLADRISENLADMARKVAPGHLLSVNAVRRAMGVAPLPTHEVNAGVDESGAGAVAGDLETELREFLESAAPSLSPHAPDNSIEDILME